MTRSKHLLKTAFNTNRVFNSVTLNCLLFSYRKFIRGKDISKYSKKDLSGILGRNAEVNDEYDSDPSDNQTDDSSAKRMKFSLGTIDHLHDDEYCEEMSNGDSDLRNDSENVESDKILASELKGLDSPLRSRRRKKSITEDLDVELPNNLLEIDNSSSKKKKKKRKLNSSDQLHVNNDCIENCDINSVSLNDTVNAETDERLAEELRDSNLDTEKSKTEDLHKVSKKKSHARKLKLNSVSSVQSADTDDYISLETDESTSTKKVKKRKLNLELRNNAENGSVDEPEPSELKDFDMSALDKCKESSRTKNPHKTYDNKSSDIKFEPNSTSSKETDLDEFVNISLEMDDSSPKKKVKKKKVELDSNLNQTLVVNKTEQNGKSDECDLEIDSSAPVKKRKKKSVIDSTSKCEDENQSSPLVEQENTVTPEQCSSSAKKRRKDKVGSSVDDFDYFMEKVTDFNASTDPKTVIEEFEKNKEALLKRYRDTYLRSYLESANEGDSRIYCDLNGDELDCKNGAKEDDCDEADVLKKKKQAKHVRERPLTKAERIVLKARLLKTIQNKSSTHNFSGSNLNDIVGYGNKTVST